MPLENRWYGKEEDKQSTEKDLSSLTAQELYKEATTLAKRACNHLHYVIDHPRFATENFRSKLFELNNRYNETMHHLYTKLTKTQFDSDTDLSHEDLMKLDTNLRQADSNYAEVKQENWRRVFLEHLKNAIDKTFLTDKFLESYKNSGSTIEQFGTDYFEALTKCLQDCHTNYETIKLMIGGSLFTLSEATRGALLENEFPMLDARWDSWRNKGIGSKRDQQGSFRI